VVAVADRRSFRLAARDCRVAQPSLSAQLAQAEEALGVRIFERDRHGVRPTLAGEELVARARALLADADELVATARRLGDPRSGRLRVGILPTIAPYLLPLVAPALHAALPRLQLVWTEERTEVLLDRLGRGQLDAAVVAADATTLALPHRALGHDPFVLAVAPDHPLATAPGPLTLEGLHDQPLLLLEDGHCLRDQALAACALTGAREAEYRATSLATLVQMVAAGLGVTLLPRLALDVENRRGGLVVRPFDGEPPGRDLVLVWRRSAALAPTAGPVAETMAEAWRAG
jgi:LysR family hydrogen peroxide-inducible transcriptional activator